LENESLEAFLRRKNKESELKNKTIDWERRKQHWLASIEKLYEKINGWLNSLKNEGIVKINYEETELLDDNLGSYIVKNMTMRVGAERVILKPKGMIVMGAAGRVDMIGYNGTVWLVLLNEPKKTEFEWHIAVRTVRQKYWPLIEESFTDALKQVMQP